MLDSQETIVALSSAPGPGARAIVRMTGAKVWGIIQDCFQATELWSEAIRQGCWQGNLQLPEVYSRMPCQVLVWRAPRTYTGQDLVEIHTLSSPPLVEALIAHLLKLGARPAQAGEFTMRAFLAGKLDLTQAEAVLAVIEADSSDELKIALGQLAGGMAKPLHQLRDDLLGLLAEVEAGLDFAHEDLQFLSSPQIKERLQSARQTLGGLLEQLQKRAVSGRPFRVVLTGQPNAGKSSLFNALAGGLHALVSPEAGTTRDYLIQRLNVDGMDVELIDTAGEEPGVRSQESGVRNEEEDIAEQAQQAREEQIEQADLLLTCIDVTHSPDSSELALLQGQGPVRALPVWTKCDLLPGVRSQESGVRDQKSEVQTSVIRHQGITELRLLLAARAREARRPSALMPSWSRCRRHVEASIEHLQQAEAVVAHGEPQELLALELRMALDQLGEMVGAVYNDELLDRIFGQFCIGK